MPIITSRQERERLVLELYYQDENMREIARETSISFRDIGVILNKVVEEKSEGSKEQQYVLRITKNKSNNNIIYLFPLRHTNSFLKELFL